jgi:predicted regulator of Ras-like GTPase activity (Roadblock/LC7/MglB family)
MMRPLEGGRSETSMSVGIEDVLKELVRGALRESSDVMSMAIGDQQGLPIVNSTKGNMPVMTYTAMATMAYRATRTAAETVGLERPEYVVVHSPNGILAILGCEDSNATLVAQLKPTANLGLALVILQRLAKRLGEVLAQE